MNIKLKRICDLSKQGVNKNLLNMNEMNLKKYRIYNQIQF